MAAPKIDLFDQQYLSNPTNIDNFKIGLSLGDIAAVASQFKTKYNEQYHESAAPYYKITTTNGFILGYGNGDTVAEFTCIPTLEISSADEVYLDGGPSVNINYSNQTAPVNIWGGGITIVPYNDFTVQSVDGTITLNTNGTTKDINISAIGNTSNVNLSATNGIIGISGGESRVDTSIDDTDSPYAILITDYVILADSTSGNIIVTLPEASVTSGRTLHIKNIGSGTVTINRSGSDTIDADTSIVLNQYESLNIIGKTNIWHIL
jgi:hypothetical protein